MTRGNALDPPSQQAMGGDDKALRKDTSNARRSKTSNTFLREGRPKAASSASELKDGSLTRGSAAPRLSACLPMVLKNKKLARTTRKATHAKRKKAPLPQRAAAVTESALQSRKTHIMI